MNLMKDVKIIWHQLTGFKKKLFFISLVSIIGAVIAAFIPYIYGKLVDIALAPAFSVWLIFSLLSVWFLLSLLSNWITRYVNTSGELYAENIMNNYSFRLMDHIIRLPMSFHDDKKKGELISQISRSGDFLYMIIHSSFFNFLTSLFTVLIVLIFLANINAILFLLLILVLLLYAYISVKKSMVIAPEQTKLNKVYERVYGDAYESMINVDVVKNNANEDYERLKFQKGIAKAYQTYKTFLKLWRNLDAWQQTIFTSGFVLLFGLAVFLMRSGVVTPGNLVTFVGYIFLAFQPFSQLAHNYRLLQRGLPSIKKADKLMNQATENYLFAGGVDVDEIKGKVEFRNIHFAHASGHKVFQGISFEIKPGEAVALVGESGSGKSTLVKLLQRYYIPQKGRILVDGQDVRTFNLKSYRDKIAVVPQEVILFNNSIEYNLKYGNFKAGKNEVREAAREANAEEFIKVFKKKYNQLVGERGVKLSVGQKQRVAIARAILRNPDLLILDEATSSLDSKTERLVQQALRRLIHGRTSIIIAHRFSTITFVDRIIVLKKGKIVEVGTHSQLMRRKNEYYRLYTAQASGLHDIEM